MEHTTVLEAVRKSPAEVRVANALADDHIQELKDKLEKEKVYLEEIRCDQDL